MAIQIKEWGMLRAPADSVQIPLQGLMGWGAAARNFGSGTSSVLLGSMELARDRERVAEAGDLAEFSKRLHAIGDDTKAELADREVQDWDYAWQEVSGPRLAEAVAELPPASRQAGKELAEAFNSRASVMALRDREVDKIRRSREQWQQRIDDAVQAGDERQACRWLQSGEGVFVAPDQMKSESQAVSSQARAVRWKRALQESPLQALAEWGSAKKDSLPENKAVARGLEEEVRRVRKSTREALANQLSEQALEGAPLDEVRLKEARRAHLISQEQYESSHVVPRSLSLSERCDWLRRVDECADDAEAVAGLKLDIATSAIPADERRQLLERLKVASGVSLADRQTLSRQLWSLYRQGAWGCPGDGLALRRLAELQRDGLPVLAEQGAEMSARWVDALRLRSGRLVCFSSHNDDIDV